MLATGKLPPDAIPGGLANQDCMLGMEFSGFDSAGNRVMGLVPAKVRHFIYRQNNGGQRCQNIDVDRVVWSLVCLVGKC